MAMNHSALNLEMERSKLIKTNNPQPLFQEKKRKNRSTTWVKSILYNFTL